MKTISEPLMGHLVAMISTGCMTRPNLEGLLKGTTLPDLKCFSNDTMNGDLKA